MVCAVWVCTCVVVRWVSWSRSNAAVVIVVMVMVMMMQALLIQPRTSSSPDAGVKRTPTPPRAREGKTPLNQMQRR